MDIKASEFVVALEKQTDQLNALCGEMIATLKLNEQHFLRGDEPARQVFLELLGKWENRYKRAGQ